MRIIDSNKDFYDFYQNIYRDSSLTFDRRDSYDLSKEEFASHFYYNQKPAFKYFSRTSGEMQYVLLQVCNTFWFFALKITRVNESGKCVDYELRLLDSWKDYTKETKLICLSHVGFRYYTVGDVPRMIEGIKTNDYFTLYEFNKFDLVKSSGREVVREERHIPILQNIGIAGEVDPLEIYLAIEEFLGMQITNNERTESIGLTDKEKVENHGFDTKESFRGKRK